MTGASTTAVAIGAGEKTTAALIAAGASTTAVAIGIGSQIMTPTYTRRPVAAATTHRSPAMIDESPREVNARAERLAETIALRAAEADDDAARDDDTCVERSASAAACVFRVLALVECSSA